MWLVKLFSSFVISSELTCQSSFIFKDTNNNYPEGKKIYALLNFSNKLTHTLDEQDSKRTAITAHMSITIIDHPS